VEYRKKSTTLKAQEDGSGQNSLDIEVATTGIAIFKLNLSRPHFVPSGHVMFSLLHYPKIVLREIGIYLD
jgi:hypothetical protein